MQPSRQSIHDIFETQRRYLVPLYQRSYVWTREKQWEPLWQDIEQQALTALHAMKSGASASNHFLGAIVISARKTVGLAHPVSEIIDGQQRLTTFQLFLAALRDAFSAYGEKDGAENVQRLTGNPERHKDPEGRHKVWPTNSDRPAYVKVTLAGSPERVREAFPEGAGRAGTLPRMAEAYLFFAEAIRGFLSGEEMPEVLSEFTLEQKSEALQVAIRDQLMCVVIELEERDDPQIIFETLNARGQPLLPSDLIRNYLFLEAANRKEDINRLYNGLWKPFDTEEAAVERAGERRFWHQEERQGRLKRPKIDLFMFHFITLHAEREVNIGQLYTEFRSWNTSNGMNVVETLREICEKREIFRELLVADGDDRMLLLARRVRALDTSTIHPLLMYLLSLPGASLSGQDRARIASDIESWLVRRFVCRLTTKNYNRFFVNLLSDVKGAVREARPLPELVRAELSRPTGPAGRWPDDEEFRRGWLQNPVYVKSRPDRAVMLLEAIEKKMRSTKSEAVDLPNGLTVEHLLPQTTDPEHYPFGSGEYLLENESPEQGRERLANTVGNLTLLTSPLNSAISNGPIQDKLEAIAEHSLLRLNRAIRVEGNRWTENEILKRGQALFQYAKVIWSPPAT